MKYQIVALTLLAPTVLEARECVNSAGDQIVATSWSAKPADSGFGQSTHLSVTLENKSDTPIRMIDGTVFFDDVLGRSIVNISISEDARIDAQGTFQQSGTYQSFGGNIERLVQVEKTDVVVTTCVKALVKGDGSVVSFSGK